MIQFRPNVAQIPEESGDDRSDCLTDAVGKNLQPRCDLPLIWPHFGLIVVTRWRRRAAGAALAVLLRRCRRWGRAARVGLEAGAHASRGKSG